MYELPNGLCKSTLRYDWVLNSCRVVTDKVTKSSDCIQNFNWQLNMLDRSGFWLLVCWVIKKVIERPDYGHTISEKHNKITRIAQQSLGQAIQAYCDLNLNTHIWEVKHIVEVSGSEHDIGTGGKVLPDKAWFQCLAVQSWQMRYYVAYCHAQNKLHYTSHQLVNVTVKLLLSTESIRWMYVL